MESRGPGTEPMAAPKVCPLGTGKKLSVPGRRRGQREDTTTHSGNYQEYPLDQQAHQPTGPPEMMSTLGSLLVSPRGDVQFAPNCAANSRWMKPNGFRLAAGSGSQRSSGVVSPGEAGDVGISAAVQRLATACPASCSRYLINWRKPVRIPYWHCSPYRCKAAEISDTVEGFIGIPAAFTGYGR